MTKRTMLSAVAAVLVCMNPAHIHAQEAAQDRTTQVLLDSITKLLNAKTGLENALKNQGLPIPRIQSVATPIRFDNRAYVPVEFQDAGIGRVRVTIRSTDNSHSPQAVITPNLAASHLVEITGLIDNKEYGGTVEILTHAANTPATDREIHPVPKFRTAPRVETPVPTIHSTVVGASTATVRARANQDVLFRVLLYGQTEGGVPTDEPIRVLGDEYSIQHGAPQGGTPARQREISIAGLAPGGKYYVRVSAINPQGRADTTDHRAIPTLPREFGFSGPTALQISPTRGLVVSWRSTAPADSGRLRVPFPTADGYSTYKATQSSDSMTFTATIPYTAIQSITTAPTLTITLFPRGGGAAHQTEIAMGIEKPEVNSWANTTLPQTQRRDMEHIYRSLTQGKEPDLGSLLRSGLKAFTKLAPVIVGL